MNRRHFIAAMGASAAAQLLPGAAFAQQWPSRPIRFMSGFNAGSGADLLARGYADELTKILAQQVIVENRTGAGGAIAADATAKAPPNGYTFHVGTNGPLIVVPSLGGKLTFDPEKDLRPVAHLANGPLMLVASPTLNVKTYAELVEAVRKSSQKAPFASVGVGSVGHLYGETFVSKNKLNAEHIPYRSGVQAFPDVLTGRIHFMFTSMGQAIPLVKEGKLIPIMHSSTRRLPVLPDVPAAREVGLDEIESDPWNMLFAPAKTPDDVISRMNAAVLAAQKTQSVQDMLARDQFASLPLTVPEVEAFLVEERKRWAAIARTTGVKLPE